MKHEWIFRRPETRMGYADMKRRLGKKMAIKYWLIQRATWWYHKVFHIYVQIKVGDFTYHERVNRWRY